MIPSTDKLFSINIKDYFKINIKQEFTFERYISECEKEILNIMNADDQNDNKYLNFIAALNSGKTFSLIDICNRNNIKAIIAVPLQVIARQKTNEYQNYCSTNGIPCNVKAVFGMTILPDGRFTYVSEDNITDYLSEHNTQVFVSVFDSLKKFSAIDIFNPSEYILIVDEAHNLVTQYDFRWKTIQFLTEYQKRFRKVIHLTGTPEATLLPCHSTYIFNRKDKLGNTPLINLFYSGRTEFIYGYWFLFNMIISDQNNGIKVILHDNKNSLDKLKQVMVRYGINQEEIMVLHSDNRNSPNYFFIERSEFIPDSVKYLLTTRLIADGANIRSNIESIYMLNVKDFWLKRQFIGRFRNQLENIYDIIFVNTNQETDSQQENVALWCEEIETNFGFHISHCQSQIQIINNSGINVESNEELLKNSLTKNYYVSEFSKTLRLSKQSIQKDYIDKFNNLIYKTPALMEKVYIDISSFEVNLQTDVNLESIVLDLNDFKKMWNNLEINSLADSPEILKKHFKHFLWAYLISEEKELYYLNLMDKSLYNPSKNIIKGEVDDYLECMKDNRSKGIMKTAVQLARNGMSEYIIVKLLTAKIYLDRETGNTKMSNNLIKKLNWSLNNLALSFFPEIISIPSKRIIYEYVLPDTIYKLIPENKVIDEFTRQHIIERIEETLSLIDENDKQKPATILNQIIDVRYNYNISNIPKRQKKDGTTTGGEQRLTITDKNISIQILEKIKSELIEKGMDIEYLYSNYDFLNFINYSIIRMKSILLQDLYQLESSSVSPFINDTDQEKSVDSMKKLIEEIDAFISFGRDYEEYKLDSASSN